MAKSTVFYSWQSDIEPAAANRTLIQRALEDAAADLGSDPALGIEPVIERDTQGLAGAPDIRTAIFEKIDNAQAFVADVTPIAKGGSPNANVLVELGYAIAVLGWNKIVLVLNTAFGAPEELPFDLRHHRCATYESEPTATERAPARKALQRSLKGALALILKAGKPASTYVLGLERKNEKITGERHDYLLHVTLRNTGTATVRNWHVDLWMPREVLSSSHHAYFIPSESTSETAFFRFPSIEHKTEYTLYPSSTVERTIPYMMTTQLYHQRDKLFERPVIAKAYVNDELADEVVIPFGDRQLQNF